MDKLSGFITEIQLENTFQIEKLYFLLSYRKFIIRISTKQWKLPKKIWDLSNQNNGDSKVIERMLNSEL